jgi:CSLREA domain-containing protein
VRTRTLTATVSVLVALAGLAPVARAATIPVTTLDDLVNPGDGVCSLREAILAVDAPPGAADCIRANANTIALGPGKHVLTRTGPPEDAGSTGDLDVDSGTVTLTVKGAGAGATSIDGAGLGDRLFDIAAGAPGVAFESLTLTGGRARSGTNGPPGVAGTAGESGGAIRSLSALSLTDVTVADNRAGTAVPVERIRRAVGSPSQAAPAARAAMREPFRSPGRSRWCASLSHSTSRGTAARAAAARRVPMAGRPGVRAAPAERAGQF